MRSLKTRLAVAALTFVNGASADSYARQPGVGRDCRRVSARCHLVAVADQPLASLRRPVNILNLLAEARRTN